jgi:hypothetical protein
MTATSAEHAEVEFPSAFTLFQFEFSGAVELIGIRLMLRLRSVRSFTGRRRCGIPNLLTGAFRPSSRRRRRVLVGRTLLTATHLPTRRVARTTRITGRVAGVATGTGPPIAIPFALLLALALPIPGVDEPGNGFDPSQGIDVGVMYHVILDPARKTLVKLVPEGRIAPLGEKRELVEFDDISRNTVAMFHATEPDAIFRVPNRIVRTEIHGKLLDEDRKVSVPSRNGRRIV